MGFGYDSSWREPARQRPRDVRPMPQLRIVELDPLRQRRPALGPSRPQQCRYGQRPADVPARHHVGEGVVVSGLVILVRADHAANVVPSVRFELRPASPEAHGLQQDLGAGLAEERVVAGGLPVVPDRIGDVGADLLLLRSAQDIDDVPVRPDGVLRRRLLASVGGLPGVYRAPPTQSLRLGAGGIKGAEAIGQQPAPPSARSSCRTVAGRSQCPRRRARGNPRWSAPAPRSRRSRPRD